MLDYVATRKQRRIKENLEHKGVIMKIDIGMIEQMSYEYPGVHLIHLKDGRIIGISEECVCLYKNLEEFYDCGTHDIPTISLLKGD